MTSQDLQPMEQEEVPMGSKAFSRLMYVHAEKATNSRLISTVQRSGCRKEEKNAC